MVKFLLSHDADQTTWEKKKQTPLHFALRMGMLSMRELFAAKRQTLCVTDIDGNTGLHHVAQRNEYVLAESLIQAGSSIQVRNKAGHTPLFCAALIIQTALGEPRTTSRTSRRL